MPMVVSCSREMMVTLRGISVIFWSVPNTELNGREDGIMFFSIGTSLTSRASRVTTSSLAAGVAL